MKSGRSSTLKVRLAHLGRIASLVVPSWGAWYVAFTRPHPNDLVEVVTVFLGPLWAFLAVLLTVRSFVAIVGSRGKGHPPRPILARIDVLTGAGVALAWSSAAAIALAVLLGYASLAVVGLLGTSVFHLVVLYAFLALRSADPIRQATITRRFGPSRLLEGESVVEEITLERTRIPLGYRLFLTGRVGPRWAVSRHVVDAADAAGQVVLESEVGPALRGEHEPEPLVVWLEDVFGLCRGAEVAVGTRPGESSLLRVLPKTLQVDSAVPLLDRGIGPRSPRPASRLPTEGLFHLREYQQGDDVRRIHWVRSATAGELIVRMPDEIPPDRPRVRLVLDTFFPEAFALDCAATAELLDTTVGVWLAVGRALVEAGVRVTLVAAVADDNGVVGPRRHELFARERDGALRLGAEVAWQSRMMVDDLLTDEATWVVSRGVLAPPPSTDHVRWILVFPGIATELKRPLPSAARLPFPMGSSENRWSHRRAVVAGYLEERRDHARAMLAMRTNVSPPPPGSLAASPAVDGSIHLQVIA